MDATKQGDGLERFHGIFKPTPRALWMIPSNPIPALIKDGFKLTTLFTIGAVIQCGLFLILPTKYAIIPCSVLTLNSIISTILEIRSLKPGVTPPGAVPGRVTAQLPDAKTGIIPATPASKPLVVFHLGVRFNHPLGQLAPGGREIAEHSISMNKDLLGRASEYGLYHSSTWLSADDKRGNTLMTVYYFRDVDGLHRFAHDPIHRKGWDWYNRTKEQYPWIGIFHETFVTGPQQYETIYANMKPTLLGAASLECEDEQTKEKAWVNTLVSCDVGPLRSQMRRMGKTNEPLAAYV
ncbi:hypothetical protein CCHL11_09923 [Colletotrichum chlorophyti]|uniref:Monooxygenase n=1 Tax=Colletotrichum chlorophyti TaxID=708187 RepID=A0A1Q8RNB8_9PEZI|nr:hypothetical protein CCHL11_09923 [Colletotrichum chlorophyti]